MTTFKALPVALQTTAKQYLASNKNLTLLSGKRPIKNNWTELTLSEDKIYEHDGNLGWVLGVPDLVVDVDPKNGGIASYDKLVSDLGLEFEPTVRTQSGGWHVYLSIPENWQGKKLHKTLNKKYPGIDFLFKGSQCVIAGSSTDKGSYTWFDDLLGGFTQTIAPEALLLEISQSDSNVVSSNNAAPTSDLEDFNGLIGGKSANWSEEKVLAVLSKLDPSMENDRWVKVGMALNDWHPVDGLKYFEDWSRKGDNYTEGETAKRWKSFKVGHGVTLGSLVFMADAIDPSNSLDLATKLIDEINNADEITLRTSVKRTIKASLLEDEDREKLVNAYQKRTKELTDVKPQISKVRRDLASNEITSNVDDADHDWTQSWVYVATLDNYVNKDKLKPVSIHAFNMMNGRYIPFSVGGTKPNATKYVADRGLVTVVDTIGYLPMYDDFICNIGNETVANTFNRQTLPVSATKYSDAGLATIELVKAHIKFICTTDENAHIFTQWLAHQVQFMGKQIRWSPVIQGIEGVGKSFFAELLRACLGDKNVGTVSPTQVTSDFNGWATNVVVNVLEELHVKGHNRHESMNALKPLITDRMIQINEKGVKQYMTLNTTNYVCFTNHKDSLPLEETDRRWWVLFVEAESLDDISDAVGESQEIHFQKLFNAIRSHGAEIRKWFLEYVITDEFMSIKTAPMTDAKLAMIATEENGLHGLHEVKAMIAEGGDYYNKYCICSSDLFKQVLFVDPDLEIENRTKNTILKKLGYTLLPNQIRIDGKVKRFWTKRNMTNDEIKKSLADSKKGKTVIQVEDYFKSVTK